VTDVTEKLTPYGRGRKLADQRGLEVASDDEVLDRAFTSNWKPFPLQEGVLATDDGVYIVIAGLGGGKTLVGANKLVRWVLENPRRESGEPTMALVLGKDFRLVKGTQFKWILYAFRQIVGELCQRCIERGIKPSGPLERSCRDCVPLPESIIVKSVRYGDDPTIELWNGCEIKAYSGTNADSTRGPGFDFIWIDEGEYLNIDAFETGMGRLRSAAKIRVIITSSPDGAGWLYPLINGEYEEWKDLRTATEVRVFRWRSRDNPVNQGKVLKTLRAIYSARGGNKAAQELDGRFLGTSEAPGSGVIQFERAFVGQVTLELSESRAYVIGADLARAEDFCWYSAVNARGVVLEMERFNWGTVDVPLEKFWVLARRRFLEIAHRTGALIGVVDTARGGEQFVSAVREDIEKAEDPVTQALRARGFRVIEVASDSGGKRAELFEALDKAFQMSRTVVPTAWAVHGQPPVIVREVETVRLELKKIQAEQMPGGKRKFVTPPGVHDDGIVSLALATHGIATAPPPPPSRDLDAFRRDPSRPGGGRPAGPATPGRGGGGRVFGGGGRVF
jgi:hypothetical protein